MLDYEDMELARIERERREKEHRKDVLTEIKKRVAKPKKAKKIPARTAFGPNNHSLGTVEAMVDYLRTPKKRRDASVLDTMIYNNGLDAVPFPEIARMTGLSVQEVRTRFMDLVKEQHTFSQEEMKLMLTAQLQRVINMMTELASKGSERHSDQILKAIERLQKMYDLESTKANITIQILTIEQTNIFVTTIGYVLEKIMEIPEIAAAVDREAIEQMAATALGEASALIYEARDRTITVDPNGEVVPD